MRITVIYRLLLICAVATLTLELDAQVQFRDSYSSDVIAKELAIQSTLILESETPEFQVYDIEGRIEYALSLISKEEFDEAIDLLNEAKRIYNSQKPLSSTSSSGLLSQDVYVAYLLAVCHSNTNNLDRAKVYYNFVIDEAPYYVTAYNDFALLFLHNGQFDSADYFFNAGLKINPSDEFLIHNQALSSFYQSRVSMTYSLLKRNIQENPEFLPSYYLLASIKDAWGDEKGAKDLYALAIERNPGSLEPFLFQARFYYWSGKFTRTKRSCISALEIEPGDNTVIELLGMAQLQSGDYANGIRKLALAFTFDHPSHEVMLENLTFSDWEMYDLFQNVISKVFTDNELATLGEFIKSLLLSPNSQELIKSTSRYYSAQPKSFLAKRLNLLSQAVTKQESLDSDLIDGLGSLIELPTITFLKGRLLLKERKFEEALAIFDELLIDCDYPFIHYNRALVLKELGRLDESARALERGIDQNPRYSLMLFELAHVRRLSGNYEAAKALQFKVLSQSRLNGYPDAELGRLYYETNSLDSAIHYFDMAIDLNPRLDDLYHLRGDCHHRQGNFSSAIADYTSGLTSDGDHMESLYSRAEIYMSYDEYPSAVADLTRCINLNPDNDQCRYNRGISFEKLNDHRSAIADFHRLVQPSADSIKLRLGVNYYFLSHYDSAIFYFLEAESLLNTGQKKYLARSYLEEGRIDDSINLLEMNSSDGDKGSQVELATVYLISSRYEKSKALFMEILKENSDDLMTQFKLALLELITENAQTAQLQLAKFSEKSDFRGHHYARLFIKRIEPYGKLTSQQIDEVLSYLNK